MIKKETIGKIQAGLGILLLIGTIVAFVLISNSIREMGDSLSDEMLGLFRDPLIKSIAGSNESICTLNQSEYLLISEHNTGRGLAFNIQSYYATSYWITLSSGIIVVILSIILILQGLANLSERR